MTSFRVGRVRAVGVSMRALCATARREASAESLAFLVAGRGAGRRVDARHSVGLQVSC